MPSILLTDDSQCARGSEAQGRGLTPVSLGQTLAGMPRDALALALTAPGGEVKHGARNEFSEM